MGDSPRGSGWERLFWLVFERTGNPLALLDEERRIVAVNQPAADLLGGSREELEGRSIRDSVKPSERELSDEGWRRFLQTGEYFGSRDMLRADGEEVKIEFAARLAEIGGRRLAIYVAMALTEEEPVEIARAAANLGLTEREREIVTLIAMGRDTGDIAGELHISPETVRTHVRNAMGKLDVHTRAQLVAVVLTGDSALHREHVGAD
jgi:PAS domain S-box-containing protein